MNDSLQHLRSTRGTHSPRATRSAILVV